MDREMFMREAICQAWEAFSKDEVPVGAVIVRGGEIIAKGRNRRIETKSALAHAELEAIKMACEITGDWRLEDCEIYVTLEPCSMCAGAIINARLPVVCFGASDTVLGAAGGACDLFEEKFSHKPEVYSGILGEECAEILSLFFKRLRERKTAKK